MMNLKEAFDLESKLKVVSVQQDLDKTQSVIHRQHPKRPRR